MLEMFGVYSNMEPSVLHEAAINMMKENESYWEHCGSLTTQMNFVTYSEWKTNMSKDTTMCDEFFIFVLSKLHYRHTLIYTANRLWSTMRAGSMDRSELHSKSDLHLVYLGNNTYGELRRKPMMPAPPTSLPKPVKIIKKKRKCLKGKLQSPPATPIDLSIKSSNEHCSNQSDNNVRSALPSQTLTNVVVLHDSPGFIINAQLPDGFNPSDMNRTGCVSPEIIDIRSPLHDSDENSLSGSQGDDGPLGGMCTATPHCAGTSIQLNSLDSSECELSPIAGGTSQLPPSLKASEQIDLSELVADEQCSMETETTTTVSTLKSLTSNFIIAGNPNANLMDIEQIGSKCFKQSNTVVPVKPLEILVLHYFKSKFPHISPYEVCNQHIQSQKEKCIVKKLKVLCRNLLLTYMTDVDIKKLLVQQDPTDKRNIDINDLMDKLCWKRKLSIQIVPLKQDMINHWTKKVPSWQTIDPYSSLEDIGSGTDNESPCDLSEEATPVLPVKTEKEHQLQRYSLRK